MTQDISINVTANTDEFMKAIDELAAFNDRFPEGSKPEILSEFLLDVSLCGSDFFEKWGDFDSRSAFGAIEVLLKPGQRFLDLLVAIRAFDFDAVTHSETP